MIVKIIEILRITCASFGVFWSYYIGMSSLKPAESVLHYLSPWLIVSIAGTSGIEGLFLGKVSAKEKGFEIGSNYQRQSAIALLSYAFISLFVYFKNLGTNAEITIVLTFMFFMIFSAINHTVQTIAHRNFKWTNINRPFLTILLIIALWYPIVNTLK